MLSIGVAVGAAFSMWEDGEIYINRRVISDKIEAGLNELVREGSFNFKDWLQNDPSANLLQPSAMQPLDLELYQATFSSFSYLCFFSRRLYTRCYGR